MADIDGAFDGARPPRGEDPLFFDELVNLNPHSVLTRDGSEWVPIRPDGQVAWIPVHRIDLGSGRAHVRIDDGRMRPVSVPLTGAAYGLVDPPGWGAGHDPRADRCPRVLVEGLPEARPGVGLIVSPIVAAVRPGRLDLLVHGPEIRDERGNISGYDGFEWHSHPGATARGVKGLVVQVLAEVGLRRTSVRVTPETGADRVQWRVEISHTRPRWWMSIWRRRQLRERAQRLAPALRRELDRWGLGARVAVADHYEPGSERERGSR